MNEMVITLYRMLHLKPACLLVLSGMLYIQYMYIFCQLPMTNCHIRGATQNFREFEYTAQTVSTTNSRR